MDFIGTQPQIVIAGSHSVFDAQSLRNMLENFGTELILSPYIHKSNGLSEQHAQTLFQRICTLKYDQQGSWIHVLDQAIESMNATVYKTTSYPQNHLFWGGEVAGIQLRQRRLITGLRIQKLLNYPPSPENKTLTVTGGREGVEEGW